MPKLLYIVTGDMSCPEMFLLNTFIQQLSPDNYTHYLLAPPMPLSHINLENEMGLAQGGGEFTYEKWQHILHTFQPDVAFLCDPYILLYDQRDASYFKLSWFNDLACPLAILDMRANLMKTENGGLALAHTETQSEKPTLYPDYLIKVCPPHDSLQTNTPGLLHWRNMQPMPVLSVHSAREQMRQELGCNTDTAIVTLFFPLENILIAIEKNLATHYTVVIETLIHYLNQIEGQYQLYVINIPDQLQESRFDNVNVRFFKGLSIEMQERLLNCSDLFLTESLGHPTLIHCALGEIPAVVLGNSLHLQENHVSMAFKQLTPFIHLKVEELKELAPHVLFPYTSFPSFSSAWTGSVQTGLISGRTLFYFADVFDELTTGSLLASLLRGTGEKETLLHALQAYHKKMEYAHEAEDIVHAILYER